MDAPPSERKLLELRNGGAMTVEAGGAVRAGYYYLGRGAGTIEAGEFAVGREVKITSGGRVTTYPIAPILSLGDATFNVRTAGDLRLQTFLDPLMVGRGDVIRIQLHERPDRSYGAESHLDRRRHDPGRPDDLSVQGPELDGMDLGVGPTSTTSPATSIRRSCVSLR